jgi:hypoxanthine phosphoribosyltransferase
MPDYRDYLEEILIDEPTLQARVAELAAQLDADYAGVSGLVLVCILKGGIMFLTDLMRRLHTPHSVEFIIASTYGAGVRHSSGQIKLLLDIEERKLHDKHVLIVEDIIDSGNTLAFVRHHLESRPVQSVKICTLLNKPSRRETPVPVEYVGFDIPNKFVFGYGLDLDELYRNLPFIGVVRPDAYLSHE